MPQVAKGHIEQLPSGSFRVVVFAGYDLVTRRRQYFKSTAKTEAQDVFPLATSVPLVTPSLAVPGGARAGIGVVLWGERG